ncbi:MAG: epoxyqueuosine reductase [Firmicutes bacterium]|nr:epoxyqueuosine reductase [Bacillota bacterium]
MEELISAFIERRVAEAGTRTVYRRPIVGFADALDELFHKVRQTCGPQHLMPSDLLADARGVVAFFVPFTAGLVRLNARDTYIAREWALAYIETNRLIGELCTDLAAELKSRGVKAAWVAPTHEFDAERLVATWSHRHVAYVAGLGTFGLNNMLITAAGCAGRLGSVVIDAPVQPTARPSEELCRHYRGRRCVVCVQRCPIGALTLEGFDRKRCYAHLLQVNSHFSDLPLCDVCGKCATGPCALTVPGL